MCMERFKGLNKFPVYCTISLKKKKEQVYGAARRVQFEAMCTSDVHVLREMLIQKNGSNNN